MENPYKHTGKESELETLAKTIVLPGYSLVNFNKLFGNENDKGGITRNQAYILFGTYETAKVAIYVGLGYTVFSVINVFSNAFQ